MDNCNVRGDRLAGFIVWGVGVALLVFAISSCGGPRVASAQANLKAVQDRIYADGVVTPEENIELAEALAAVGVAIKEDAERVNWPQTITSLLLGLIAGVPAAVITTNKVRNTREEKLWGTPASPKV